MLHLSIEVNLFTDLADFGRVRKEILRPGNDGTVSVTVILLNVDAFIHVLKGCFVVLLANVLSGLEIDIVARLLVTLVLLSPEVFKLDRLLVRVICS